MSADARRGATGPHVGAAAGARRGRRSRALSCAAALIAVTTAGSLLHHARGREPDAEPAPALPELEPSCRAAGRTARTRRGQDASAAASAAIERYPFAPGAGLSALRLLREATRCFELAGEPSARAESEARAAAWRTRLQGDCRDRFVRYRLALASQRLEHALADVEFLLALCAPADGPLAARLRRAQLEITDRHHDEEAP